MAGRLWNDRHAGTYRRTPKTRRTRVGVRLACRRQDLREWARTEHARITWRASRTGARARHGTPGPPGAGGSIQRRPKASGPPGSRVRNAQVVGDSPRRRPFSGRRKRRSAQFSPEPHRCRGPALGKPGGRAPIPPRSDRKTDAPGYTLTRLASSARTAPGFCTQYPRPEPPGRGSSRPTGIPRTTRRSSAAGVPGATACPCGSCRGTPPDTVRT